MENWPNWHSDLSELVCAARKLIARVGHATRIDEGRREGKRDLPTRLRGLVVVEETASNLAAGRDAAWRLADWTRPKDHGRWGTHFGWSNLSVGSEQFTVTSEASGGSTPAQKLSWPT